MRKLASLSPIMFYDRLKIASVSFFIAEYNLISCEFDSILELIEFDSNFTFKLFYCDIDRN